MPTGFTRNPDLVVVLQACQAFISLIDLQTYVVKRNEQINALVKLTHNLRTLQRVLCINAWLLVRYCLSANAIRSVRKLVIKLLFWWHVQCDTYQRRLMSGYINQYVFFSFLLLVNGTTSQHLHTEAWFKLCLSRCEEKAKLAWKRESLSPVFSLQGLEEKALESSTQVRSSG